MKITEEQKEIVNELIEFMLENNSYYFEIKQYYGDEYIWINAPELKEDFYRHLCKKEK